MPRAPASCSSCRRSRGSTPRPWGHWRAHWPMRRPSAAPSRSCTGRAPGSGLPPRPGRLQDRAPAGPYTASVRWRAWDSAGVRCSPMAAGASCTRAARPSRFPTTGCSSRPVWREVPGLPWRPRSAPSAGRSRVRWPRPARMRAGWSRTRSCRSRPSWSRPTWAANATAGRNARPGAGRRAIPSTNSALRRAARSRSHPPASPSMTVEHTGPPTEPTWRSGCSRRSPSPRSGRAGAAMR